MKQNLSIDDLKYIAPHSSNLSTHPTFSIIVKNSEESIHWGKSMQPLENQTNVFGDPLESCSMDPLTGFFRTGCCDADSEDIGKHFVCAHVDDAFLQYSLSRGNDLITARPEFGFAGLKSGDQWCVCANRWLEAFNSGCAPPVVLTSTNAKVLELIDLATLKSHAVDLN